jgi:hypothetical protein
MKKQNNLNAATDDLECGDMSPLSDWATCRPVPKRGRVRALQTSAQKNYVVHEYHLIISPHELAARTKTLAV